MANALSDLKNLKTWQKVAILVGGLGVAGYVWYKHEQDSSSSSSTTAANSTSSTTPMVTDPSTGEEYPADSVDPMTGETYSEEIDEYGSVEAAESAYDSGDMNMLSSGYYPSDLIDYGDYDYGDSTNVAPGTMDEYATNAQWSQAVESGLSSIGYSSTDVATALGYYLADRPLVVLPDGQNSMEIIEAALAEYGPPPQGSYSLIPPPTTAPASSGSTTTTPPTTTSGDVKVTDVVGRTDLAYAESLVKSTGLNVKATGDTGVGNTGKVTSQSPAAGTMVPKGTTVTLVYTSDKADNAQVSVPNEVGRIDLDTAETDIKKAGLNVRATGDISKAKGNKGKVTAQSPAAGTKVSKGTTVTLTYN